MSFFLTKVHFPAQKPTFEAIFTFFTSFQFSPKSKQRSRHIFPCVIKCCQLLLRIGQKLKQFFWLILANYRWILKFRPSLAILDFISEKTKFCPIYKELATLAKSKNWKKRHSSQLCVSGWERSQSGIYRQGKLTFVRLPRKLKQGQKRKYFGFLKAFESINYTVKDALWKKERDIIKVL